MDGCRARAESASIEKESEKAHFEKALQKVKRKVVRGALA
jgi:hypothetical protein